MPLHSHHLPAGPLMGNHMASHPHAGDVYNGQPIFNVLERVMLQVEYHGFKDLRLNRTDPFYKELCLIIAEVLVMGQGASVKINGSLLPAQLVQDVYSKLCHDHVRLVFDNFHNVSYPVRNKKAYLRTALYNSFFEIESHFINAFAASGEHFG